MNTLNGLIRKIRKYGLLPQIVASSDYLKYKSILTSLGIGAVAVPTDPYFANVVSLLHFDGNLTDQKGKTWTAAGNASANTSKFGGALMLDGTGDYISTTNHADLYLTGDFTVECWVYPTNLSGRQTIWATSWSGTGVDQMWLMMSREGQTAGNLELFVGSYTNAAPLLDSSTPLPVNTWTFVTVKRSGNSWSMYFGDTQVASASGAYSIADYLTFVGTYFDGVSVYAYQFRGYIDDVRISKGLARTVAIPTAAFSDSDLTNVSALLHFDGNLTDVTGKTWTAAGNAKTGSSKFGSNALALDGSGDYVYTPTSSDFSFGSGDFVVDFWIRPDTVDAYSHELFGHMSAGGLVLGVLIENRLAFSAFTYGPFTVITDIKHTLQLSANTWYYCAIVRTSGSIKIYCGAEGGNTTSTNTVTTNLGNSYAANTVNFRVGSASSSTFPGRIDEFRVTKGTNRGITANFAVPTAAFPNQ